jgi:transketolase
VTLPDAVDDVDLLAINTLKFLAVDAIEAARSGHPGLPLGAAELAYLLFTRRLRHDPSDPHWRDRDRFLLSPGHGSALLYGLLHLTGYDLPLDELKRFRQWGSKTPGHPEVHLTPGVEVTTGPLGQGFGNAVGMALAAKMAEARLPGLFGHRVWALVSDGDVMEGVAYEAASLAGHLGLGNLICIYDDNKITLDGALDEAFSEDVARRFDAMGWHTVKWAGSRAGCSPPGAPRLARARARCCGSWWASRRRSVPSPILGLRKVIEGPSRTEREAEAEAAAA